MTVPHRYLRVWIFWRRYGPRLLWVFVIGAVLAYIGAWTPYAVRVWTARSGAREVAREAKRLGLTYDDALENPTPSVGKPVRWYLMRGGDGTWHYEGRLDRPVGWSGPPPGVIESRRPYRIVATIVEVEIDPPKVVLRCLDRG